MSSINIKEGLSTLSTAALLVHVWNFSRIYSTGTYLSLISPGGNYIEMGGRGNSRLLVLRVNDPK
jgi:hypothetical protein